jgi:hypothetical protein
MGDIVEAIGAHGGIANEVFRQQFFHGELSDRYRVHYERNVDLATRWLGAEIVEQVQQLGRQAADEYSVEQTTYREAQERAHEHRYPEALKARNPETTPLFVLPLHIPLHANADKYDGTFVNPLVRALKDPKAYTGIRSSKEDYTVNRAEELAADNITFLQIDDSFFEVVEDRGYTKKLKIDTLSEDDAVELFSLTEDEHGSAEIALVYDWQASHTVAKLAEAVRSRVGKYPHIIDEQEPIEFGVGFAWWRVYEYVPIPPAPVRPSLKSVLAARAVSEAMQ